MGKAIVTCGNSGWDNAIVLALAQAGYDTAFSYEAEEAVAQRLCRSVSDATGKRCVALAADVSGPKGVVDFVGRAAQALGGLDVFVNDAARMDWGGPLAALKEEELEAFVLRNFAGTIAGMREAACIMTATGTRGRIINITSARAYRARPGDGVFGGLMAAIHRAAESFALDVAPQRITVNCVAPGLMQPAQEQGAGEREYLRRPAEADAWVRDKIPLRRMGTAEDIGNAVVFLASEEADYITGIHLRVDGGQMLATMPDNRNDCSAEDFIGFDFAKMKKPIPSR